MNMIPEDKSSDYILVRIRTITKIKKLASSRYFTTLILLASLGYTSFIVSIVDVYSNTINNRTFSGALTYFFGSLIHSQILVQISVLIALFAIFRLMLPLVKRFVPMKMGLRRVV